LIYTLTLNPALDYVLKVENFRTNDISRADDAQIYYGGKGINVSVILTRLNIENIALGFVGGFSGNKLCEMLAFDGIKTDFTKINSGDTRINVKIKTDKEIDINTSGPKITDEELSALFKKLDAIQDGDYLVLSGSIPKGLPTNIYEQIIENLSKKNVNFIIDTADKSLIEILKYKPFLIKPNHHELGDLFNTTINSSNDIICYAKELQTLGAKNVLVSRAENGALLLDENGRIYTKGIANGKLINSVGCGDSMVAGFLAGYIERKEYEYALTLASACGCATAFSDVLATRSEIDEIFRQL